MTARDYFAAAAITGLLAYKGGRGGLTVDLEAGAAVAYATADAMLAERKKP